MSQSAYINDLSAMVNLELRTSSYRALLPSAFCHNIDSIALVAGTSRNMEKGDSRSFLFAVAIILILACLHARSADAAPILKEENVTVFWHDTFNVTDFIIINGVSTVGLSKVSPVSAPFGTTIVFDDAITESKEPDSAVVGSVEGTATVSSLDGLTSLWSFTVALNTTDHKGEISFLGHLSFDGSRKAPLVGGTDDFLLVAGGYAVVNSGSTTPSFKKIIQLDVHLFWTL
eukprot:c54119_g1_i1 orf=182-874(-)